MYTHTYILKEYNRTYKSLFDISTKYKSQRRILLLIFQNKKAQKYQQLHFVRLYMEEEVIACDCINVCIL